MTPEDRAKKLTPLGEKIPNTPESLTQFRKDIVIQIREAIDEAHNWASGKCNLCHNAFISGRASMQEEAAKVAEAPMSYDPNRHSNVCYFCDCHGECPQEYIPKQIRAIVVEDK